jgi:uracil-DNA glycosylase
MQCDCHTDNVWGSNHVNGDGPIPARVMLIGEAPGAEEDQIGKPFVGGSGRILGRWFYEAGVFRGEVRLDNVYSHRPPGNDLASAKPNRVAAYESLARRISQSNPRVIIAAGETALQFFGKSGITDWRGSCWEWQGHKVVATLHPAFIMRVPTLWRFCVSDLRFAFRRAEGWNTRGELAYELQPTAARFAQYCESIRDGEEVSLDIETTVDKEWQVTQINLSNAPRQAVVVDMDEEYLVPLMRLLRRPIRWVGQNIIMFDALRLSDLLGSPPIRAAADIMLAHHLLESPAPHDLGFINSCYTRYPYFKDQMASDRYGYGARDADTPLQIWQMMKHELVAEGMWGEEPSLDLEPAKWGLFQTVMRAAHYVQKMYVRGVPVDREIIKAEQVNLTSDSDALVKRLQEMTGMRWFNPRSSKDCKELLYDKLGAPRQYNRKGRERIVTTDDDALVKLGTYPGRIGDAAKLILACRRPLNDLSKYFRPDTVTAAGRWHPDWKVHGTETGRYSCWFHTLPPRVRHVVRQPGKLIAYVDAQQGEFRIATWCSGDQVAKEVQERPGGVHNVNASEIFTRIRGYKVAPQEVTPMMRFYAKFTTFGWIYGRQAPSISEQYGIPLTSAQEIVDGLEKTYKGIVIWKADTAATALGRGELRNPYGRRRYFPGGSDADKEREAYATIPQSTLHDILMRAHILVEESFTEDELQVVADMHDALLMVVDPVRFDRDKLLQVVSREYLPGLLMPFDVDVNEWWVDKRAEEDAKGKVILS